MVLAAVLLAACLVPAATAPRAAAFQDPPRPEGFVTDLAGYLEAADRSAVEARLRAQRDAGGAEVAVLTIPSLDGRALEDYAIAIARAWGLGHAERDDGVLLLVADAERKVRIEVGDGVEGELTDLVSGRIIDLVMVPEFRAGHKSLGLRRGAEAIVAALGGDLEAIPERAAHEGGGFPVGGIIAAMLLIQILLVLKSGSRGGRGGRGGGAGSGMFWTWWLASSVGGSRGLGRGGGFGGGGGGFSGGGASGGW